MGQGVPHVRDVGATVQLVSPGIHRPIFFVASDGSLWFLEIISGTCTQVPSPGDLTRVSVAPDGAIWCVDKRDVLWTMRNSVWSRVDIPDEKVREVDVAPDGTVYLVMANSRYYSIVPGGLPFFHGVFILVHAIAGLGRPDDVHHPFGQAWGVSPTFGDGALCRCQHDVGWSDTNLRNVSDLAVARDGVVWMAKTDGTVWTTADGITQLRMGTVVQITRVAAHSFSVIAAVASDGTAWIWANRPQDSTPVGPAPIPPPPPPPPHGSPPTISVSASGGGTSTVFTIAGTGFLPSVQLTVKGTRIGDGEIHQFFWTTMSDAAGAARLAIDLPCVPGIVINFSANDGRRSPTDLTERLWSNTVQATCPPG
jgi:hypothetical protein